MKITRKVIGEKRFKTLHLQIFYTITLCIIMGLIFLDNRFISIEINTLLWINNINFILLLMLQYRLLKTIVNPLTLYSIILFLFTSGQLILYSMNIEIEVFNIFERLDQTTIKFGVVFIILAYTFFQLGLILSVKKNNIYTMKNYQEEASQEPKSILYVGLILIIIGIIPYGMFLYDNLSIVLNSGYGSYYQEGVRSSSFLFGFSYYLFTGIVFCVIAGTKKQKKLAILFLLIISLIRLVAGDRGDGIVFILSSYLLYKYFVKSGKDNIPQLLIISVIVMALVPIIGILRQQGDETIIDILEESNIVVSILSNLGGTFWPLGKIMELIPDHHNHIYGASYLAGFLLLIPSPFRIGPISDALSNLVVASPASWLQNYLNMTYGPGFTPFAESYLNFGWTGIIFMILFGILIGKLFTLKLKGKNNSSFSLGLNILAFQLLAMSTRGTFNNMIAFYFRYIIIPIFLVYLFREFSKRRNGEKI